MKKFALIGAAGYIAPRHMNAIKETGNEIVAALDKNDSVGILDSYFPEASFFTEFERFDRHVEKLRRNKDEKIDYVSICSPNYLHDAHIRFALRIGADAICEKPLVLNPWNVSALQEIENESDGKINTILQLRLHSSIKKLKEKIDKSPPGKTYDVDLTYITPRGRWYLASWKGDVAKSGGVITNIGVHFFDMLSWIFGSVKKNVVYMSSEKKASGFLELDKARIRWFLSLDRNDLRFVPVFDKSQTYRSITIDNNEIEFSEGFTNLHTESYKNILEGRSFGISDVLTSIKIVSDIRKINPIEIIIKNTHPVLMNSWSD